MYLSISERKPIGNAIITCLNQNQSDKRSSKGKEADIAVLKIL
jgi:6,7-dimethyl-8-ribityllumazine synthase